MIAPAVLEAGLTAVAVLPIRLEHETFAVLELFSDEPHPPSETLENLMNDVSTQIARVLERERLVEQMADLVWREQQNPLRSLHDSLGQTLAGLGMLASGPSRHLDQADAASVQTAREIAGQARQPLEQVRQLAKNIFPVAIEPGTLMAPLQQLATTTTFVSKTKVGVAGRVPESVRDGATATQLYRIAQEAVNNALKHARARHITIQIGGEPCRVTLQIADDGAGTGTPRTRTMAWDSGS